MDFVWRHLPAASDHVQLLYVTLTHAPMVKNIHTIYALLVQCNWQGSIMHYSANPQHFALSFDKFASQWCSFIEANEK